MPRELAEKICDLPPEMTFKECHSSSSKSNFLCKGYHRCRIEEKTYLQLEYVKENTNKHTYVNACPGAGKTEVVGLKTAYEISKWRDWNSGIAVLTFTNNAADVITARCNQFLGTTKIQFPHYIGTFDSWLHGFLCQPFAHSMSGYEGKNGDKSFSIIDDNSTAEFLVSFTANIGGKPNPRANQYFFDTETASFVVLPAKGVGKKYSKNDGEYTALFEAKKKFWKNGFMTYQDAELFSLLLLSKSNYSKRLANRFPFVIVDECQDLSPNQLKILNKIREEGTKIHFVGDLDQSIYNFKKVDPLKISNFITEHKFNRFSLSDNFRSCQDIVNVIQSVVGKTGQTGKFTSCLATPCICIKYDPQNLPALIGKYHALLKQVEIAPKNARILVRNWGHAAKLKNESDKYSNLKTIKVANATYLATLNKIGSYKDAILLLGEVIYSFYFKEFSYSELENYCPSCTDSLSWRRFLASILYELTENETVRNWSASCSSWAKYSKKILHEAFLKNLSLIDSNMQDKAWEMIRLTSPSGQASTPLNQLLPQIAKKKSRVEITSIHNVKGQTFESVLIFQPSRSKWAPWKHQPDTEEARLAYVACSRPQKLLVWCVSQHSTSEIKKIEKLGFEIVSC